MKVSLIMTKFEKSAWYVSIFCQMQAEKPPNSTFQILSLFFPFFSVKVKVHFTGSESWIGVEHLKGKGTKYSHFIFPKLVTWLAADLALPTLRQVEIHQQYDLYSFGFTFFHLKGWLAIAKLKPLSHLISLLSMPKKAFDNVKIEK